MNLYDELMGMVQHGSDVSLNVVLRSTSGAQLGQTGPQLVFKTGDNETVKVLQPDLRLLEPVTGNPAE